MERESFVFYRSFFEAISCLNKEIQADCYDAVFRYAFYGEEPVTEGIAKAMFLTMKPQIDANNRRYANGCKGGKPKANQSVTKGKPKANQSVTKQEPNDNVNDNDNDNENVNVNDNENVNEKKKKPAEKKKAFGSLQHVKLTDREYDMLVAEYGVAFTQKLIDYLDGYMEEKPGYKTKSHYLTIKRWVVDAVQKKEQIRKPPTAQPQVSDFFSEILGGVADDG